MDSLARLQEMSNDAAWALAADVARQVEVLTEYRVDANDLIPDALPVIGLLDDAVLVDVALQLLRDEVAGYEDFCRFRRVAADFAGMSEVAMGLTRRQWLEALLQARQRSGGFDHQARPTRYVADPRASLFHVL